MVATEEVMRVLLSLDDEGRVEITVSSSVYVGIFTFHLFWYKADVFLCYTTM